MMLMLDVGCTGINLCGQLQVSTPTLCVMRALLCDVVFLEIKINLYV